MKRIHLIPNMITAFGLSCGLFAIFKVNMVEAGPGLFSVLSVATWLVLAAAFADLLDGAVARAISAESEFGLVFDSLADAVSFGVTPSVLLLKSLSLTAGSWLSFYAILGCMLYSLCGVLRLVRYNANKAQIQREKGRQAIEQQNKHFTGLPIPAAAIAAISANLFLSSVFASEWLGFSESTKSIILSSVMVILGYFMVSRWKFPSAKALHVRLSTFDLVLLTVVMAVFVIYGMLYFFPVMLVAMSWSYLIIAWGLSLARVIAGKKSKTLEDYEPDQEDEG